jgi:hypothetical protein
MRSILILAVAVTPLFLSAQETHTCQHHKEHHSEEIQDMSVQVNECSAKAHDLQKMMEQHAELKIMDHMGKSMVRIADEMVEVSKFFETLGKDEKIESDIKLQGEMHCLEEHLGSMGNQLGIALEIMERIMNHLVETEVEK